jgi:Tol biopolymer transport system component
VSGAQSQKGDSAQFKVAHLPVRVDLKGDMEMKKVISRILVVIIYLTILLSGCNAKGTPASTPTSTISPTTSSPTATSANTASPNPTATLPAYAGTIAFGKVDPALQHADIYLIQTNGADLKQLTGHGGDTEAPAWSPDGSKIAYHFAPYNYTKVVLPYQIWVMNADGSGQTQLTRDPIGGAWPSWSRDGKQIVFNDWYDAPLGKYGPAQIYIINADGSDMRRVTNGPDYDFTPIFAPDGKILFLRFKFTGLGTGGDVFEINPDGTDLVQLTSSAHVGWYALSPDGTLLAIHNTDQHSFEILTMDGSQPPKTLLDNDFSYTWAQVVWSPDGKALAIAPSSFGYIHGFPLYIVNADGSGLTKVPNTDDAYSIAWRP